MSITLIAAVSENGVIGKDNSLPWRLAADLKFFKEITMYQTLIMGRRCYESIGRPLPNRQNIVISRQIGLEIEGCTVVNSLSEAINESNGTPFVIGGSEIYKLALPYATKFYRTNVHSNVEGEVYFPEFDQSEWSSNVILSIAADEKNQYSFDIELLTRTHYDSAILI